MHFLLCNLLTRALGGRGLNARIEAVARRKGRLTWFCCIFRDSISVSQASIWVASVETYISLVAGVESKFWRYLTEDLTLPSPSSRFSLSLENSDLSAAVASC